MTENHSENMLQEMKQESGEITKEELSTELPLATYGILRKMSIIRKLIKDFNLIAITTKPDKINGYGCYFSNGINMAFKETEKQKSKHPNKVCSIGVTVLSFKGKKEDIQKLYEALDLIETGYERQKVITVSGQEVYLYVAPQFLKQCVSLNGGGMVLYPDTVMGTRYFMKEGINIYEQRVLGFTPYPNEVTTPKVPLITEQKGISENIDTVIENHYEEWKNYNDSDWL